MPVPYPIPPSEPNMPFHTLLLPNGLQLIGETIPSARSVSVGFFVRTGSRDETVAESGVSHFLEHMMFKGTPRRTALEVNRDFDRIGASYNAYTSEEVTAYYASVLPEYLPTALDILADILRPSLRDDDFATEKNVILEEIKMYDDQPGSMAWDHAKRIYYGTHSLGNSILGTNASVTALTRDQMHDYYGRRYGAPNITVSIAGQFDWPAFAELLTASTAKWPTGKVERTNLADNRGPGGVHAVAKEGTAQEHVLCLGRSIPAESMLRYSATTLAIAVGDDSGSRLHWELVDPGLVESASCGVDASQACGLMGTSFSCDPESAAENLAIVRRVLGDVQSGNITAGELSQAKNKIASRVVRYSERPSGRMRAIAGSWMYNAEFSDPDMELARYDAVSLESIRDYLKEYPIDDLTVVGYGPVDRLE